MALLLNKTDAFGVVSRYHVIDRLDYDKSYGPIGTTLIHLSGWSSVDVRLSTFPQAQIRSVVSVAGPVVSLEAAYNYVKTLPEWQQATDA